MSFTSFENIQKIGGRAILLLVLLFGLARSVSGQFQANGDANSMSCGCYQLTPDAGNMSGSVWNANQIDLTNPFDFSFEIFLGCNNSGADGVAFVLQGVSTTIGTTGGGIGYQGILPSLAVEFDTYQNSFDPGDDHIAIMQDGVTDHGQPENLAGPVNALPFGMDIEDCNYHDVRFTWDPATQTFEVYFDGLLRVSTNVDMVNTVFGGDPMVYWGFTSATGGLSNEHRFCTNEQADFEMSTTSTCAGDSVQFSDSTTTSTGDAMAWDWDFGDGSTSTDQFPTHKYSSGGSYQVKLVATTSYGCQDSVTKTINVLNAPTLNLNSAVDSTCDVVCDGEIDVYASGGTSPYNYSIDSGATFQSTGVFSNLCSDTYQILVEDDNGCSDTLTVPLSAPASVTYTSTTTNVMCSGDSSGSIDIDPSGGSGVYTFSNDSGATFQNDSVFNNLSAGSYDIVVQDTNGCKAIGTETISGPSPMVFDSLFVINNNGCSGSCGGEVHAYVSGGTVSGSYTYSWSGGIASSDSSYATNVCSGSYSLTVLDDNGCQLDTNGLTIQPSSSLSVDTGQVPASCGMANGKAFVVPTSGSAPYTYQWGAGANNQTTDTATGLAPGTYAVYVQDSASCDTTVDVVVDDQPGPSASLVSADDVSCEGDCDGEAEVTANNGTSPYTYDWTGPTNNSGAVVNGLCAGDYDVLVTDSNGCEDSLEVTVGEPNPLTVDPGNDTAICDNGSANLSASASGGNPSYTYTWSDGGSGANQTVSPDSTTVYEVQVTDSLGCNSSLKGVTVEVFDPLSLSLTGNREICAGDSVPLSADGSGGDGTYTYNWSNGSNDSIITVGPASTTTYSVTVADGCGGSTGPDSTTVTVHANPDVDLVASNVEGCRPLTAEFVHTTDSSFSGNCIWDFGDGEKDNSCDSVSHVYQTAGTYDVELAVMSSEGCQNDTLVSNLVQVYDDPVADFLPDKTETTTFEPVIEFEDRSLNADAYEWDFAGLGTSSKPSPSFKFPAGEEGTYSVCQKVVTSNGCADSTCQEIIVNDKFLLYVPNAFSPDGDGKNDKFYPVMQGDMKGQYEFHIYDRWGEKIFSTDDPDEKWDGTYRGEQVETGVYVWQIEVRNDNSKEQVNRRGHVVLLR